MPQYSFIKWTGSKRFLAPEIMTLAPKSMNTYYEPFLGGGFLLSQFYWRAHRLVGCDIIPELIALYNIVKDNPGKIIESYRDYFNSKEDKKELYFKIREEFNKDRDPLKFYYLTRTSVNGLIRFNSKGEFNAACHYGRRGDGAVPEKIQKLVIEWSELFNSISCEFRCASFDSILPEVSKGDFVFLDPPYLQSKMYSNMVSLDDIENFLDALNRKDVKWMMTFGGIHGDKNQTVSVSKDLYKEMGYFTAFQGKFDNGTKVQESWYRNYS